MFSKSEKLLIIRFLFSKKTDGYISIFSCFSIVGISLGVAAIIIVMSVMNGFREDLTSRIIGVNSHLNIYSYDNKIIKNDIDLLVSQIENSSYEKYYQSLETNGLIIKDNESRGIIIRGYDTENENLFLRDAIIEGKSITKNYSDIIIGDYLANKLDVKIGDNLKIAIPKTDKTILGNIPRFKTLNVVGIFDFGLFEYDSSLIFVSSDLVQKLLLYNSNEYNKIEFYIKNPNNVDNFQSLLNKKISENYLNLYSYSWKDANMSLINALKIEKNVMFIILTLIILVASLNIVSGLIIFVKEKNRDIGILKTLGLSNLSIIKIFFTIGATIGLIGSLAGTFLGIIFTLNIESIQYFLENLLNTRLFQEEIYYLSSLPSKISITEITVVFLTSISISIISTLFPAIRSARVDPIQTIRSE
tara:strand:+ start:173 stop:1423 length:1251 start_codon:yes stop_codon:yes gene_type:complete